MCTLRGVAGATIAVGERWEHVWEYVHHISVLQCVAVSCSVV